MSVLASWLAVLGGILLFTIFLTIVGSGIAMIGRWLCGGPRDMLAGPSLCSWDHCENCNTTILHGGHHDCGGVA